MMVLYLLLALLLIFLNAFFVLAEFAAVKARPTQIEVLVAAGNRRARIMERIQAHLDEYLSVCQVGITLASIGLGFVGEPAFAELILPAVKWVGIRGLATAITAHGIAVAVAIPARVVSSHRARRARAQVRRDSEGPRMLPCSRLSLWWSSDTSSLRPSGFSTAQSMEFFAFFVCRRLPDTASIPKRRSGSFSTSRSRAACCHSGVSCT